MSKLTHGDHEPNVNGNIQTVTDSDSKHVTVFNEIYCTCGILMERVFVRKVKIN